MVFTVLEREEEGHEDNPLLKYVVEVGRLSNNEGKISRNITATIKT